MSKDLGLGTNTKINCRQSLALRCIEKIQGRRNKSDEITRFVLGEKDVVGELLTQRHRIVAGKGGPTTIGERTADDHSKECNSGDPAIASL